MRLIDGKATAAHLRLGIKEEVSALAAARGRAPGLAVVLVGDDPASEVYVRNKLRACQETGIVSSDYRPGAGISQRGLLDLIDTLNADSKVDGILVQLPLPGHLDAQAIMERIRPDKDVDGFHPINMGKLAQGLPGLAPCTPRGVMRLFDVYGIPVEGKTATVIGCSNIVGMPMTLMMLRANATVTTCHVKTKDLKSACLGAEIIISAAGVPGLVKADMVSDGVVVIDVGMNRNAQGKLCGDVDYDAVSQKASAITPVPGGVGPMTIAMLLANTLDAYKARLPDAPGTSEKSTCGCK